MTRPETSIVIRTFNEERDLPRLLEAIHEQRYVVVSRGYPEAVYAWSRFRRRMRKPPSTSLTYVRLSRRSSYQ